MKPLSKMISAIKRSLRNDLMEQDHLLQQQQDILHHGIETTVEVLDIMVNPGQMGNLVRLKLWIKLRKLDGNLIYFHTLTLLPLNLLPRKGDLLHIKYLPDNRDVILVL